MKNYVTNPDGLAQYHLSWKEPGNIRRCLLENRRMNGECWEWTRACDGEGYGQIYIDKKRYSVHRVSKAVYEYMDIHTKLSVLHHCDNPKCFRPDHLYAGTVKQNFRDAMDRGLWQPHRGTANKSAKLNDTSVRTIREMRKAGAEYRDIAALFGVSRQTVQNVCDRKYWTHIL